MAPLSVSRDIPHLGPPPLPSQFCVIDRVLGQLMVQEQSLPEPRPLENLLLCTTKPCTPDFIDRNFCFRVRGRGRG